MSLAGSISARRLARSASRAEAGADGLLGALGEWISSEHDERKLRSVASTLGVMQEQAERRADAVGAAAPELEAVSPAPEACPAVSSEQSASDKDAQEQADYETAVAKAKEVPLPRGSTWRLYGGAELEPLLVFTTLICVRWLLKFAKGEVEPAWKDGQPGVVPAWQQVPEHAKVKVEQLRLSKMEHGLPVAVLSYGWASQAHPDPTGEQLTRLIPVLMAIVAQCDQIGPAFTWGMVWDFMSLPQRGRTTGFVPDDVDASGEVVKKNDDRTIDQLERFGRGLRNINVWYGAAYTHTLVLNTPMPSAATNKTKYEDRGWCIFECSLSALVKDDFCYLELKGLSGNESGWQAIRDVCKASRKAPVAPDAFEAMMREGVRREESEAGTGIKFTSGKDLTEVVIPQYERAFLKLMGAADKLMYTYLGWGDDEIETLARRPPTVLNC
jgi:hypothetical protein